VDLARYRSLFLDEARRLVSQGEVLLHSGVGLSGNAPVLFRIFHTLKGMAATMQQAAITLTAHACEDVCDALARGTLRGDDTTASLLGEGFEVIRDQLRAFEAGEEVPFRKEFEQRVRDWARAGGTTAFTLLVARDPEPTSVGADREDAVPTGIKVDLSIAAVAEIMSACARLREVAAAATSPESADAVVDEASRIEESARNVYRELVELRQVRFLAVVPPLRRHLRNVALRLGKQARLEVHGEEVLVDQALLGTLQSALVHLVTNAVVHGIEEPSRRAHAGKSPVGRVSIQAERSANQLSLAVSDDGRGLDASALRTAGGQQGGNPASLAFEQGVSTAGTVSGAAGRGVGLPAVKAVVESLGGRLAVSSVPDKGTRFRLQVPMSNDLARVVLVAAAGETLGIPEHRVQSAGGRDASAAPILGLPVHGDQRLLLADGEAVRVDRILGTTEALVVPPPFPLNRIRRLRGTTVASDGRMLFVVDP
jgi:chemotaxis protein histidine kinase CheA